MTEQPSSGTLPFVTAKGKKLGIHTEFGILSVSTGQKKGTWLFLSTAGICEDGIGKGQSDKKNYENTRKEEKKPLPGSLVKASYQQEARTPSNISCEGC